MLFPAIGRRGGGGGIFWKVCCAFSSSSLPVMFVVHSGCLMKGTMRGMMVVMVMVI